MLTITLGCRAISPRMSLKTARRREFSRPSGRSRMRPGTTSGASAYIMSPTWQSRTSWPCSAAICDDLLEEGLLVHADLAGHDDPPAGTQWPACEWQHVR